MHPKFSFVAMRISKANIVGLAVAILWLATVNVPQNRSGERIPAMPKLLSQREQMKVRSEWLRQRLDTLLLPMMKRNGIDVWIVINEEFHADPVTEHIVPPIPVVGRRDFFVFVDRGDRLDRYAVVRYEEEQLKRFYNVTTPPRDKTAEALRKIIDERNPKTIALNFGGTRGAQGGLTHDGYKAIAEMLGSENEKKFVSSGNLLSEFFDTRLPDELDNYRTAVLVTDILTRRAFSNEVIKPGRTTVGDVRWWLMQQVNDLGLSTQTKDEDVIDLLERAAVFHRPHSRPSGSDR